MYTYTSIYIYIYLYMYRFCAVYSIRMFFLHIYAHFFQNKNTSVKLWDPDLIIDVLHKGLRSARVEAAEGGHKW